MYIFSIIIYLIIISYSLTNDISKQTLLNNSIIQILDIIKNNTSYDELNLTHYNNCKKIITSMDYNQLYELFDNSGKHYSDIGNFWDCIARNLSYHIINNHIDIVNTKDKAILYLKKNYLDFGLCVPIECNNTVYDFVNSKYYKNNYLVTNSSIFSYISSNINKEKRESSLERYQDDLNNGTKFPFHHGTHYSTSSYIYFYLMREEPFSTLLVKLQGYKQENPNRMFYGLLELLNTIDIGNDNRECIPDLFCKIEHFLNLNCVFFGKKLQGNLIDDVIPIDYINKNTNKEKIILNNCLEQFVELIIFQRKMLDSFFINCSQEDSISNWIDNVFGKYQFIENEEENVNKYNSYPFSVYRQKCPLNKLYSEYLTLKNTEEERKIEIKKQMKDWITLMINLGMMPIQIFDKPHSIRSNNLDINYEEHFKFNSPQKFISHYKYLFISKDILFIVNMNNNIIDIIK